MNVFDFLVTIALGSCLAAVSVNKNIALAEGALVYFTLIFLQFIITWTSARVKQVKKMGPANRRCCYIKVSCSVIL